MLEAVRSPAPGIRRRALVLGATAAAGASLVPGAARASAAAVLVIGGSAMSGALGRVLEEDLAGAGYTTRREAKISSGLARPDFFDWPARARALYGEHAPAATICMFGGNDGQGLHMGADAEPPWIRWHEPGWSEEYARRVDELLDAVAPAGERVFWIGMPMMGTEERTARMHRLNQIVRQRVGLRPRGYFLDTWALLADERGRYARTIRIAGRRVTVRAQDGVHYTRGGARVLADHVVPAVRASLQA
ncbi:MAG: DUF459 domain-containing protein [Myxococcales bacterium]|nr:DUF459 domain-containing protein [Myxococcales bacterium]